MKRTLVILLLALVLTLVFTEAALAGDVVITHETKGTVTIYPGDSVAVEFYWYAGSPGLVQEAIRCSELTARISRDGTIRFFTGPPETKAYWGAVQPAPPDVVSTFLRAANHGKTRVSLAYWRMPLPTGELSKGIYVLDWMWELTHRTVDLGDWDEDGHIDHYGLPDIIEGEVTLDVK
jgi:hypothetical protein